MEGRDIKKMLKELAVRSERTTGFGRLSRTDEPSPQRYMLVGRLDLRLGDGGNFYELCRVGMLAHGGFKIPALLLLGYEKKNK
jgi:hypothetical protein